MTVSKSNVRTPNDLLTAREVIDQYPEAGLTQAQLWRWSREGSFPAVAFPSGRKKFRRSDIEALLVPVNASPPGDVSETELDGQSTLPWPGVPVE